MGYDITIDRETCMGSGNCAFLAPGTFDIDDDMKAFVVGAGDDDGRVRLAAEGCPTTAIWLSRDGERVFPA